MVAVEIILLVLMFFVSVALIVVVTMQESAQQGAGTLYGGTTDLLGKNQTKSKEQKLISFTRIFAIALVVISVLMMLVQKIG